MLRVPIIWAELLLWGQFFLCKFIFIADKEGKFISITNRYHVQFVRVFSCLLLFVLRVYIILSQYYTSIKTIS